MLPQDSSELSSQEPRNLDETPSVDIPQASWSDPAWNQSIPSPREVGHRRIPTIAHSTPSRRGRKPRSLKASVERGILRLLTYTTVPFDRIAEALEKANGPKKQWLRNRISKITDTSKFGSLRVPGDSEYSRKRQAEQIAAMQAAADVQDQVEQTEDHPTASIVSRQPANDDVTALSQDDREQIDTASADTVSLSRVTRALESTGNEPHGYLEFIAKRLSATAGTIASRLTSRHPTLRTSRASSDHSSKLHTERSAHSASHSNESLHESHSDCSDFKRFYDKPSVERASRIPPQCDDSVVQHGRNTDATGESHTTTAVSLLLRARSQSMSDETAEAYFKNSLPADGSIHSRFVNAADERGITPLHLAVAYGYPRVCRSLINCGANCQADIPRFAKSAQQLANRGTDRDIKLYHRIMHCREWIKHGKAPPTPDSGDSSDSRQPKPSRRTTTGAALTAVPEGFSERTLAPVPPNRPIKRRHAQYGDDQDDLCSGEEPFAGPSRQSTHNFNKRPQFAPTISESPVAYAIPGRAQHGTHAVDFAPHYNVSRTSATSNAQTSETTGVARQYTATYWALMPSDSTSTLELPPSLNPTYDQRQQIMYDQTLMSSGALGHNAATSTSNDNNDVHDDDGRLVHLFGYRSGLTSESNYSSQQQSSRIDHQQQQQPWQFNHTGSQLEATLQTGTTQSEDLPSFAPTLGNASFDMPSALASRSHSYDPEWWTCEHGHPYNDKAIYCNVCEDAWSSYKVRQ